MPLLQHSIDDFDFIEIQGSLVARTRQLELITRKGKDDVAVRVLKLRGVPVQVQTVNYVQDFESASAAIDAYTELKDGTPYTVIQYGVDLGDFLVLDVVETSREYCVNVLGGFSGGETVRQVCQWTLFHVIPAPPPGN